jgi:hypothetical protein
MRWGPHSEQDERASSSWVTGSVCNEGGGVATKSVRSPITVGPVNSRWHQARIGKSVVKRRASDCRLPAVGGGCWFSSHSCASNDVRHADSQKLCGRNSHGHCGIPRWLVAPRGSLCRPELASVTHQVSRSRRRHGSRVVAFARLRRVPTVSPQISREPLCPKVGRCRVVA